LICFLPGCLRGTGVLARPKGVVPRIETGAGLPSMRPRWIIDRRCCPARGLGGGAFVDMVEIELSSPLNLDRRSSKVVGFWCTGCKDAC
jgi:hypothetical protein